MAHYVAFLITFLTPHPILKHFCCVSGTQILLIKICVYSVSHLNVASCLREIDSFQRTLFSANDPQWRVFISSSPFILLSQYKQRKPISLSSLLDHPLSLTFKKTEFYNLTFLDYTTLYHALLHSSIDLQDISNHYWRFWWVSWSLSPVLLLLNFC